jgi:hypothetical protein
MANVTEHIRTTCPRDCYDTCGIVVVKHDDRITQVRGDRRTPSIAANSVQKTTAYLFFHPGYSISLQSRLAQSGKFPLQH